MVLKTKSIYDKREEEEDGLRVLVTRYYPRGVRKGSFDRWVRELSPSKQLLQEYREGGKSWPEFRSAFIAELKQNDAARDEIRALRRESGRRDVTLLCYERAGSPCHRYVVAELIEKGEETKERARERPGRRKNHSDALVGT